MDKGPEFVTARVRATFMGTVCGPDGTVWKVYDPQGELGRHHAYIRQVRVREGWLMADPEFRIRGCADEGIPVCSSLPRAEGMD